ncbi:hypothetical protein HYN59_12100 [Flavobacterium album]|uniref:Receptor L-domain domain-containing protein n=1 Tax=Flavobacterium album TaxID=2175091 RepID=A0A2S1QZK2_9FLAO|nr:hypothetical protein [Flavobacterium album]AWH85805.1 hypothetical protein HYN59_12100 [Flavobacterium album]
MKKITLLCLLFFAALQLSCSNDDNNNTPKLASGTMVLETQADVDAFAASNYGSVIGDLTIGNRFVETNITDLSGLRGLTEISGELNIYGNGQLRSLEGLHNIRHAESIYIIANGGIQDLMGLRNLEGLTGEYHDFVILNNYALKNLNGLEKLTGTVMLGLNENASLESLEGLENIDNLELSILQCPLISSLAPLANVESLSISINGNSSLTSFQGIGNGPNITNIELKNCTSLISLQGLEGSVSVGTITLEGNTSLTSLQGLGNVNTVEYGISIIDCPALTSIQALNVSGNMRFLKVINSDALVSLEGLEGIIQIDAIEIKHNNNIVSLEGLQNVQSINYLEINDNSTLVTIEHLSGLTDFSANSPYTPNNYNRKIYIGYNDSLTSLHGLENFSPVPTSSTEWGSINIYNNASLQDFCAISSLTEPGRQISFGIQYNLNPITVTDIQNGHCN